MNILEYENYREGKQHGSGNFPYNTYICTIPLDFREVPEHWHEEAELIYIKKGSGIVSVDFLDHRISAPALIFILPGQLHGIRQLDDCRMEYENILFLPDMLRSRQPDAADTDFIDPLMNGRITVPTVFTPVYPYYTDVTAPIDACDRISGIRPQGYELYIKSQLCLFLFILSNRCRSHQQTTAERRKKLSPIRQIIKYIENHYTEHISIDAIAAIAGFSPSHFMRYFKASTGSTFVAYLRDYRLTMAARLLRGSEESVVDIALKTGFDNLSYFNRSFRRKYRMTPRQYRTLDLLDSSSLSDTP